MKLLVDGTIERVFLAVLVNREPEKEIIITKGEHAELFHESGLPRVRIDTSVSTGGDIVLRLVPLQ